MYWFIKPIAIIVLLFKLILQLNAKVVIELYINKRIINDFTNQYNHLKKIINHFKNCQ